MTLHVAVATESSAIASVERDDFEVKRKLWVRIRKHPRSAYD